jgi:hypothetical protein
MDLLWTVLKQINMMFFHILRAKEFERLKGSVNKIFRSLIAKEADIALVDLGYVPCFVKYPRWSSIFRILSVELWLVLVTSIVIAAISTALVGRYSCTSEWQGYKTLTCSLTTRWVVFLGVPVSTMTCPLALRSPSFAWVSCSNQVLSMALDKNTVSFSKLVTKQKPQNYKEIL